jgi:hypothetical protein
VRSAANATAAAPRGKRTPGGDGERAAEADRAREHRNAGHHAGRDGPAEPAPLGGPDGQPHREQRGELEEAFAHELPGVEPARRPHEPDREREPCGARAGPASGEVADQRRGHALERALQRHGGGHAAQPQPEREERGVARGPERIERQAVQQWLAVDEPLACEQRACDGLERAAVQVQVGIDRRQQVDDGAEHGRHDRHPAEAEPEGCGLLGNPCGGIRQPQRRLPGAGGLAIAERRGDAHVAIAERMSERDLPHGPPPLPIRARAMHGVP